MTTIGSRLRVFAEAQYGSVAAMERALGMAKHLLHKYVRDESKPGAELLQKFRSLGMSIDWLLSGDGDMLRPQAVTTEPELKEAEEILLNLNDPALAFEQLAVFASRLAEREREKEKKIE